MPQVKVQGVGVVNFPDTMSEEQITAAIEAFPATKSFRDKVSDRLYAARDQVVKPTGFERAGRGAMDVVDRLTQFNLAGGEALGIYPEGLADAGTQAMNEEQAEYQRNRGPDAGFDLARMTGAVGMTAPLALLPGGQSALGAAGYGALAGGLEGAMQYDPTNTLGGTARNVAIGAATGAVAGPVARFVTRQAESFMKSGMGRFKGVMERSKGAALPDEIIREVPEIGSLAPEMRANLILEAQRQIKEVGELNAEQLARKANLIANDVTPTKSMVTRDPRDWTMERNMQKLAQSPDEQISAMGQEMTGVYRANDAALTGKLAKIRERLPQGTRESLGMDVMRGLDDVASLSQKDVSNLYTMVRDAHGEKLASDARSLVSTLDDLRDNTYAEKLVSSVNNKLKRFGMIDGDGVLTNKTLTVSQAEELRKFVNTLPNDFGKRDIIKAIDADVLSGAGDDFFAKARGAAAARKQLLDNPATQRALNAYGELTQGKTAQNFIKSQVVDGAEQDVQTLLKTLQTLPAERSTEAVGKLRAGVLDYLQEKSVDINSNKFSGAALNKAMRDIGEGKLQLVFGDEGLKELKSLARAGLDATYEPAYAAVSHANTAPTLLSWTQKARAIPLVPAVVNEGAEKLAARSGYGRQLGEALSAKTQTPPVALSPRVQGLVNMIQRAAVPASAAAGTAGAVAVNEELKKRRQ